MMLKVYIASPYRLGDVAINVKRQFDAADKLMDNGFAPFIPLLFHFQHMAHPRPPIDWITMDLEWLSTCDCLLRLEGESVGGDQEVEHAIKLGIPVFYGEDDIDLAIQKIKERMSKLTQQHPTQILSKSIYAYD